MKQNIVKNRYKSLRIVPALVLISLLTACTMPESSSKPLPEETDPPVTGTGHVDTPKQPDTGTGLAVGFDPLKIGIDLVDMEHGLLSEMNFVRRKPQQYADEVIKPRLEERKQHLKERWKNEKEKNPHTAASFEEFLKKDQLFNDIQECYDVLQKQKALNALLPEKGLAKAARWLAGYHGKTGETGHNTPIEGYKRPYQQMKQYGTFTPPWRCGQNWAAGYPSARIIIAEYMVDDGIPSRGHRKNILNEQYTHAGSAVIRVETNTYKILSVTNFAAGYKSKQQPV